MRRVQNRVSMAGASVISQSIRSATCSPARLRHQPFPICVLKMCEHANSIGSGGIGKLQSIPWNGMDARAVPELSAKRNRFWRLPLSGGLVKRKRREHRSGLRIFSESNTDR